jgi:ATP phosphoribosyltransferase regulatory subunit HisZ
MIGEHEIPAGSNLYFGKSAKLKRQLETKACQILEENGFEEIATPCFAFEHHTKSENKETPRPILLSDKDNNYLTLRADSSLDVIRLITKRLGRSTKHKKWFYIQPIFEYPSREINQIGAEFMDYTHDSEMIDLAINILKSVEIDCDVQLSSSHIPKLAALEAGIDFELFFSRSISKLKSKNIKWLNGLINIETLEDAKSTIGEMPQKIAIELQKLIECASDIKSNRIKIDTLYVSTLGYYSGIFFRAFENNEIYLKGGSYNANGKNTFGFAIYTDTVIKKMEMEKQ